MLTNRIARQNQRLIRSLFTGICSTGSNTDTRLGKVSRCNLCEVRWWGKGIELTLLSQNTSGLSKMTINTELNCTENRVCYKTGWQSQGSINTELYWKQSVLHKASWHSWEEYQHWTHNANKECVRRPVASFQESSATKLLWGQSVCCLTAFHEESELNYTGDKESVVRPIDGYPGSVISEHQYMYLSFSGSPDNNSADVQHLSNRRECFSDQFWLSYHKAGQEDTLIYVTVSY